MKFLNYIIAIATLILLMTLLIKQKPQEHKLVGGPEEGTFTIFTAGIAACLERQNPELAIKALKTGGSSDNLKMVNKGKAEIGLAYAADSYLGFHGDLEDDKDRYSDIRALGRVYSATAELVVRHNSIIETPYDLVKRRIAIGSPGSGSAHSAERYFRSLGIWHQLTPIYIGYHLGMMELSSGRAEAVWQLVGAPSRSIEHLNLKVPLRFIDLARAARASDFFVHYPFYTKAEIPAKTYRGQDRPIETFQDQTLLVCHIDTDPQLITELLNLIYSPVGVAALRKRHPIAADLNSHKGLQGVTIPLLPVAETFWKELGQL